MADIPVPADYFGEGKIRLAVFGQTTGVWMIKGPGNADWDKSSGNVVIKFG